MSFEMQTCERKDRENTKEIRVHDGDHTPSWKTSRFTGYGGFRAYGSDQWLSMSIEEGYTHQGRHYARDTMMTLSRGSAIALRDLLNDLYPPE